MLTSIKGYIAVGVCAVIVLLTITCSILGANRLVT